MKLALAFGVTLFLAGILIDRFFEREWSDEASAVLCGSGLVLVAVAGFVLLWAWALS
jgi:hypothetical protein